MRILLTLLLIIPGFVFAELPGFTLVRPAQPISPVSPIHETEWRLTDEAGQSIGLHRYEKPAEKAGAALLYLPGTNMNGLLKTQDSRHNLWLHLAERGVTVYAMDYRTRFVPHDYNGDLAFMRDWSMDRFVQDAMRVASQVRQEQPGVPLFLAGFSRGVSFAYALAGQEAFAGLIALDGSFKAEPGERVDMAAALQRYDEEGRYASVVSRRGYEARAGMMQRVLADPEGPSLDDRYQTAGEHLSETLFNAWGPGVLANTRAGLTPIRVLAQEMIGYDWYYPVIQDIEGRSVASQQDDPNTWIDDQYGRMTLPILYFGTGRFGAEWLLAGIHSAARSGSSDVTINVLEDYGHLDVLFAASARQEVYEVIHQWMISHSASRPASAEQ